MSAQAEASKPLGFWTCWSLVVGCMIGSGVFMLPRTLAPYGLLSLAGWVVACFGSIALALVFGRLASRTNRFGGPYVYVREHFGELPGFLAAWGYWISYVIAIPVVSIAFVKYLGVFVPAIAASNVYQALSALALTAVMTLVNVRGLKEMGFVQILMTMLKLVPLLAIAAGSLAFGDAVNLPEFNPSGKTVLAALSAVVLITAWPFTGFEVVTLPAGSVKNPERTIPRALILGMLAVTAVYLSASIAVMLLVSPEQLAISEAPFADAARVFGPWGPYVVSAGAMVATAGTLNGLIFTCGQMPMAVAIDKFAPAWLAHTNKGGSPHLALFISAALGGVILMFNYTRGLIGAFEFLLMTSTSIGLFYYLACALAELRHSWRASTAYTAIALVAILYSIFALYGSGWEVFLWSAGLTVIGAPLYYLWRPPTAAATPSPS